ncbi:hypothetical protein BV455_04002 [Parageobacillus caldoxylosilyticus]|nr:hypothetical protein BSK33_16600 [Geobacillus sp. 44B]QXJ36793.1 hypothetical protein BV455_00052 [Parageobacillus caldoxylosilyticus]QXJ40628.1 hypothetical protein BV455_04002 [Parageobacillus caldoxylosilyticus]
MKINSYLIRFAFLIVLIFGGTFTFHYFKTGELLLDQLMGISVGVILLFFLFIWRIRKQHASSQNKENS